MNLEGRRESSNVEDRRGMSTGSKVGVGGIGGLIIAGIITLLMGGNLGDVLQQAGNMSLGEQVQTQGEQNFTEEEQQLAKFASVIEASTEDVWSQIFRENNLGQYQPPTLVLYTGATNTGCGQGNAAVGPFYCSADQKLYLDLSFFTTMKRQLGADGDFAYAYVIAHEVGHHIEYLTGTLQKAHQQMNRLSEGDANKVSVRLELLADFYAGVWAHYENRSFGSLDDSDLMEAIKCAQVIGDDYLQKKAQGYAMPESFTHGTSEQRMKWFKLGFDTGDIRRGTTFQQSDATL
ncbi:MAG: neutral zinc metallopeptidase [Muribaculaceae bacterium]|nr:neutral zinc metallopeptidase [Muribaculaceae bacterium]